MIPPCTLNKRLRTKIHKLGGFVKKETVRRYLEVNRKSALKKTQYDLGFWGRLFLMIGAMILGYYFYQQWKKYQEAEEKPDPREKRIDWTRVDSANATV